MTWKAREYGVHTRFIELSGEVNESMPQYFVNKLIDGLNFKGKALSQSKILVLGIAYKKNVGDMRESPAVKIIDLLITNGASIEYSDPHVPNFPRMRDYSFNLNSIDLTVESIMSFDAVVLVTDHDLFDYELIEDASKLIIDSRKNIGTLKYKNITGNSFENFILIGAAGYIAPRHLKAISDNQAH